MRGGRTRDKMLTHEQHARIIELARERDGEDWKYSYMTLGKMYGVTRCRISILCLRAGLPKRMGENRKAKFWKPPAEFRQMYRDLLDNAHLPAAERRRLVEEHIAHKRPEPA